MCYDYHQVFTWYGATIELEGATESTDYTADEVHLYFLNKLVRYDFKVVNDIFTS